MYKNAFFPLPVLWKVNADLMKLDFSAALIMKQSGFVLWLHHWDAAFSFTRAFGAHLSSPVT